MGAGSMRRPLRNLLCFLAIVGVIFEGFRLTGVTSVSSFLETGATKTISIKTLDFFARGVR
jgi:hypothetical protein